ncbi:hypothetical protein PISL3812_03133 [Talaromyces islandicus]|uniref:Uncharacterized protein n=1 Tax=Talaromyces islandicus TaxID=28573 RepID=A0A0U1LU68_TALIS|nr:hypothetical protein PISL3812_03133 [Talaromyces islandicus]
MSSPNRSSFFALPTRDTKHIVQYQWNGWPPKLHILQYSHLGSGSMNWTGGRLRRQSHARADSLLRIQKQHFVKARLKKREVNNKDATISHLRSTSNLRDNGPVERRRYSTRNDDTSWTTRQAEPSRLTFSTSDITHGSRSHQENLPSSNRLVSNSSFNAEEGTSLSYIDKIKKRLLNKKDWVGLSPTQPVQANFVPIEEKERIGKRRRLSNTDELKTYTMMMNSTLQSKPLFFFDGQLFPRMSPEPEPNIDIQIHAAEMPLRIPENLNLQSPIRTNYSDSLLLDNSIGDKIGEQRVSVNREPSIEPDKQQRFSQPKKWQRENETCNASEPLTVRSSTMPVLHRFTLDDQILAEKERSSDQQLSPPNLLGNRSASSDFDELDEQLSFYKTANVDDRFSENTGSCRSNSDLLPQTQKISRQLPPQPFSKKQPAFSTPFRTTREPQELEYTDFRPTFLPQYSQETVSFFGQSVPTADVPNGENKTYSNHSTPTQTFTAAPTPSKNFSSTPSHISGNQIRKTNGKPKGSDQPPDQAPKFRFPSHWTPHRNVQQFIFPEKVAPTSIPTSPFVVAVSRASSPFGRPRKPMYSFDKGFNTASRQSNNDEDRDVVPYLNTPFHR